MATAYIKTFYADLSYLKLISVSVSDFGRHHIGAPSDGEADDFSRETVTLLSTSEEVST